jgi:formylglycine-generating enzyme required for sulfatase activity
MQAMDYRSEAEHIQRLFQRQQLKQAGRQACRLFAALLADLYASILRDTGNTLEKRLPTQLGLDESLEVFAQEDLFGLLERSLGRELTQTKGVPFEKLLGICRRCSIPAYQPAGEEVQQMLHSLEIIISETGLAPDLPTAAEDRSSAAEARCPSCGEAVRPTWKICPLCETLLGSLLCPICGMAVQPAWKRCPECSARLICRSCQRRIPLGLDHCPACDSNDATTVERRGRIAEAAAGIEFIPVSGGDFMMGDDTGEGLADERPVHSVRLDGFYLARVPVTQGQWRKVMGHNPSRFKLGPDHPVEQVNWGGVQEFLRRLSELNADRFAFRLPTEAEWEYAARSGGRRGRYAGGDDADAVAWYERNAGGATHPVGRKSPNEFGFFDMSGNVWEWCRDFYRQDAYACHAPLNPVCTDGKTDRVIRGGSWNLDAWSVRCTRRLGYPEEFYGPGLGFRPVCLISK